MTTDDRAHATAIRRASIERWIATYIAKRQQSKKSPAIARKAVRQCATDLKVSSTVVRDAMVAAGIPYSWSRAAA